MDKSLQLTFLGHPVYKLFVDLGVVVYVDAE